MTDIAGPDDRGGISEWGRKTRPEMIALYRRYYREQLEEAEKALAIPDDQLTVTTFLGPWAQRKREVVDK